MPDELPVSRLAVDPANPRTDPGDVDDLADSIASNGMLQPIVVRPLPDGTYGVVAGRRRWAAAVQAGLDQVPARIRDLDDTAAAIASATENLSRSDLDPITEAETYRDLVAATGMTQTAVAKAIGVPESTMVQRLKLLDLPEDCREMVRDGLMSIGAAYRMVKKSGAARREPRQRPHQVTDDDIDFLDVVAVADDLVRQVRTHIREHVAGDTVTDFVARAVRRELARPSCQVGDCHADAVGGGRTCPDHLRQIKQLQTAGRG